MNQLPPSVRISLDLGAVGVGAAHMLGWWHTYAGTVVSTIGGVWIIIQAIFFFKDRYKRKK